jgi:hypothetical protein
LSKINRKSDNVQKEEKKELLKIFVATSLLVGSCQPKLQMLSITTQDLEDDINATLSEYEKNRETGDVISSTRELLQNVMNNKGEEGAEQKLAELLKL